MSHGQISHTKGLINVTVISLVKTLTELDVIRDTFKMPAMPVEGCYVWMVLILSFNTRWHWA